jgi:dolichol-phosphate mannosyltransferase
MRCMKFYAVGAMGMAVHLTLLALFVRVFEMHYQWATVFAVEAAVIHNFLWHRRWTWADRPVKGASATAARLVRFNVTNGLVSVLGNLFLMHLFAGLLRFDPIVASLLSIPPCALVNFLVSDRWVFLSQVSVAPLLNRVEISGERFE